MREKKQFVAVFDGVPYGGKKVEMFRDIVVGDFQGDYNKKELCRDAVRDSGVKNTRKDPDRTVPVDLAILTIDKGKLVRTQITTYSIPPSLERMTEEEYNQEWKELLEDIPPEFHSFIQTDCYDRGHSAGYEEVINYAHEMVYNIKGPIKNFEKRLIG